MVELLVQPETLTAGPFLNVKVHVLILPVTATDEAPIGAFHGVVSLVALGTQKTVTDWPGLIAPDLMPPDVAQLVLVLHEIVGAGPLRYSPRLKYEVVEILEPGQHCSGPVLNWL